MPGLALAELDAGLSTRALEPRTVDLRQVGAHDCWAGHGCGKRERDLLRKRRSARRTDGDARSAIGANESVAIDRRCAPAPAGRGWPREIAFQQHAPPLDR